jgi:Zn-dependent oligopeptidase
MVGICPLFVASILRQGCQGSPANGRADTLPAMLFDYTTITADDVSAIADQAITEGEALVASSISGDRTWDGTMGPLNELAAALTVAAGKSAFLGRAHPDDDVRHAATAADERMQKFVTELDFRSDLYEAVKAYAATDEAKALTGERARLVDFSLRDFRRAGHELSEEQRGKLQALKERLVELQIAFERNIDEYRDHIEVTASELDGLPDSYIEGLKPGGTDGTYKVSLDYPEYFPFMRQSHARDRRQELEFKNYTSSPDNKPILAEAIEIRSQIADLFGLPSWAHYSMEVKMAKDPRVVDDFYDSLIPGLQRLAEPEFAAMRTLLNQDHPGAELRSWDYFYLDTQQRMHDFGVDPDEVAEYLEMQEVIDGMFQLTGEVFGLEYREIDDAKAWHPDVQLFEIIDKESGRGIAHFYADLFPREGKYTHAAAFDLVKGRLLADGTRVTPVAAILANFTRPTATQPSLLKHDEVLTLFHEFGHILHHCLTSADLARFSGFDAEWDFVEAPSQIMEHWCWDPAVLSRFARHYETSEPIPDTLVKQLVAVRNHNQGTFNLRQVFLGKLDMGMHGPDAPVDLDELYLRTYPITGFQPHEGTFFYAGFGHLMGGYDAGYYGYLWAKVYGDDMYSVFEDEGVTDPGVGRRYREQVLAVGGSRDAAESLEAFLGRKPNNVAFLRHLGLGS